eukprot:1552895-Ditylum_brightwellii.AAC.1
MTANVLAPGACLCCLGKVAYRITCFAAHCKFCNQVPVPKGLDDVENILSVSGAQDQEEDFLEGGNISRLQFLGYP